MSSIAAVLNRHMVTRLWKLNGFDPESQPRLKPGRIAPVDIEALGDYIQKLSNAGFPLFPDETLERHLLSSANLPETATSDNDPDLLPGGRSNSDRGAEDIDQSTQR